MKKKTVPTVVMALLLMGLTGCDRYPLYEGQAPTQMTNARTTIQE